MENKKALLDFIFLKKRYAPLNQALEAGIFTGGDIEPYFDSVTDREEKAKLMEYRNNEYNEADIFRDLEELLNMF